MPKVTLSAENKVAQNNEYPKLSLEHGERALIVCVEPEPTVEYRHSLQIPELGPDGKVMKEEKKNSKGELYESPVYEFVGQHLCFGDFATVQEKGVDPENCPTCRAAEEEEGVLPPKQHYAMHVIKYSTQPGTWTLRDPFNVELVAWVFSPTRLNTIIDIAEEWGDLREHDLKLGPCENKKYQKYDINVSKDAQWRADEARANFVAQTYANNQCPDLSQLIARRISKADALSDIQKVIDRYALIHNRSNPVQVPDLSSLKQEPKAEPSGLDAFKKTTDDAGNSVDTTTGEVTEPAREAKGLKTMDFAEIMKEL